MLRVPRSADELLAHRRAARPGSSNAAARQVLELIAAAASRPQQLATDRAAGAARSDLHGAREAAGATSCSQSATDLQIAPELLATRRELEALARGDHDADALSGWRATVIGAPLLAAAF